MLSRLGVQDVEVEELYSLDYLDTLRYPARILADSLIFSSPVYGLIFLFKWDKDIQAVSAESLGSEDHHSSVFFMNQVCACYEFIRKSIFLDY